MHITIVSWFGATEAFATDYTDEHRLKHGQRVSRNVIVYTHSAGLFHQPATKHPCQSA
jgi:hypothetical protein